MADDGFKYSLTNQSAEKSHDPKIIGYSSEFTTLKTLKSGYISKACAAGVNTSVEIVHGLKYRPGFNAYFKDTLSGDWYQVMSGFEDVSFGRSGAEISVHAKSNNYNLVLDIFNNNAATRNVDLFYEILYEDLTTEPGLVVGG
jgi:hypothetical protein